ncbi:Pycsar system effector family protein [Flavilitoribacter nigricans]|uniref:HD family phosphohydrolase n=1 Tax=Flavilitoribacter nigricans (strain ATCC 23147 / DSM 23189 / NBRC 102662 / NCIMB 1420 / SS-2) TaxID=1122177 RepID=A0A2D0NAM9_FLAN2|nr:Pycsar system effector family protein [Flavilitoribacter nigricans]PHN05571.1 HD family phosphohydrolase [Flavilitoribacter nigricans DSM 23189 = NBRC 102662]
MSTITNNILEAAEAYVEKHFEERIPEEYVYHDLLHTKYVVEATLEIAEGYELTEKEQEIIQLAGWFHDSGYDKGGKNHEQRGSDYAVDFLRQHQYPEADIEKVSQCILATKWPQYPENLLEEIVCDADLSHLGNAWYWDRCGKVRQELYLIHGKVLSEQEWVDSELQFITNHHYHTEVARDLFDKRKEKHIRQLLKQKLRLNPTASTGTEATRGKKKKKKKDTALSTDSALELKQLNLGRGVETMFRTTYRTHVNLSSIADNKANIMLSINAIIISIVVANLVPKFDGLPKLIVPTILLLVVCLIALVYAILATRPKVTEGKFSREDIEHKRANLLFFGNFYDMDIEDFHWGMTEMIKDSDFLYSSMTRDLYYLGIVLAKKYRYLAICYSVFMYGLILSVIVFALAFL